MHHETRYAKSDGLSIAYQVVGQGPIDLVFVMGWVSHLDWFWNEPHFNRFLTRLTSFSRLILFDKRGTGLSDRPASLPTLEERMDDVRAVMDAAGSERAALIGVSEGSAMCALFAATFPERTQALVMVGGYARRLRTVEYPWAPTLEERERFAAHIERDWGSDVRIGVRAPSLASDARFREWWATYLRMSASPGAAIALTRMNQEIDIRSVLPAIHVPALVLHRIGDQTVTVENGRFLAEHIPGARLVELAGDDHLPFVGDQEAILAELEQFLTGMPPAFASDRVLTTLVFTEIVSAMAIAVRLGDRDWQATVDAHDLLVREEVARFRGVVVDRTASGYVATFDGPARALRCAGAIVERSSALGIDVRAGVHTGECEIVGGTLGGVAVQIAARVKSRAEPGEVAVSSTVRDLVAGSGIAFVPVASRVPSGSARGLDVYRVADEPSPDRDRNVSSPVARGVGTLSQREREVAVLIGRGLTNRGIAEALSISIATVERHIANIFSKLGVHSRTQVAVWVVERGLLPDPDT